MGYKRKGDQLDFHITKRPRTVCCFRFQHQSTKKDGILMMKSSTHQMMLNQNQLSLPLKKRFCPSINQQQEEEQEAIPTKPRRIDDDFSYQDVEAAETLLFLRYSVPTINNNIKFNVSAIQEQIQNKLPSLDSIIINNNSHSFNFSSVIVPQIQQQIQKKLPSLDSSQLTHNITNNFDHFFFAAGNQILSDLKVVIVKHLEITDANKFEARLSMPKSGVLSKFLTDEEEIKLRKGKTTKAAKKKEKIEVRVRGPRSQQDYNLGLTRWYYGSNKGWSYVLNRGWNSFRNNNGLHQGDLILVVAFRSVEGQLCLAIIDNK